MRKPVYELTLADLEAQPVWEFALDEEGVPGQDEATVRPYATNGQPVPEGGMFVVRAAFTLAGSARRAGYLYIRALHGIDYRLPTSVPTGHVTPVPPSPQ